MLTSIAAFTLVVADYDEAIAYYTKVLGFVLLEDTPRSQTKRWVRVAPPGAGETWILLAKAVGERQRARVGDQTGGRVGYFLNSDDLRSDYAILIARGVAFREPPRTESYGLVAVFEDLYGNAWDLIQPS